MTRWYIRAGTDGDFRAAELTDEESGVAKTHASSEAALASWFAELDEAILAAERSYSVLRRIRDRGVLVAGVRVRR